MSNPLLTAENTSADFFDSNETKNNNKINDKAKDKIFFMD